MLHPLLTTSARLRDTGPAAAADPVAGWRPPPAVLAHTGEAVDMGREFFANPPAEIGTVLSAHSTLKAGTLPMPIWQRLAIATLIAYLVFLPFDWQSRQAPKTPQDVRVLQGMGLVLGGLFAIIPWWKTRFRHQCTFVGDKGVARYTLKGARDAEPRAEVMRFADLAELRTRQVRQYMEGIYTGTKYDYRWVDAAGRQRFRLKGHYVSKDGNPKPNDPFHFAVAAELSWSNHLLDAAQKDLSDKGHVQFGLKRGNWVRVGAGFMEFNIGGQQARFSVEEVKKLTIGDGVFNVQHRDAGWFSRKGKFSFEYGDMANARMFLLCLERLLGYRFE